MSNDIRLTPEATIAYLEDRIGALCACVDRECKRANFAEAQWRDWEKCARNYRVGDTIPAELSFRILPRFEDRNWTPETIKAEGRST